MTDFEAHLTRQIAFSRATFGPGDRRAGVIEHIRKELIEVENAPYHHQRISEWVDVVILALDGLTREIATHPGQVPFTADETAVQAVSAIIRKQSTNELREWPDWRVAPADKAIEHVRREPPTGEFGSERELFALPHTEERQRERLGVIAQIVHNDPRRLEMRDWHSACGTAHCLAGWATHLAGIAREEVSGVPGGYVEIGEKLLGEEASYRFNAGNRSTLEWLKQFLPDDAAAAG